MKPRVLTYAESPEQLWIGLDAEGMRRKVFKLVSGELTGAEHLIGGVTVFSPGEESSVHVHEGSEEINFVLSGHGEFITDDGVEPFGPHQIMYVPQGMRHGHRNTGTEPLILGFVYSPQAELPST